MSQSEERYSILDVLAKASGYDIALMTSFNFEIPFFERFVLSKLFANDVKKVSLFVDARELTQALSEVGSCALGRKYLVSPVDIRSSFHPKVILLLGETRARLIVGSANIKTSGYASNNEVLNDVIYTKDHPEYLDVICAAIDFFDQINQVSYRLDDEVLEEAKSQIYYHRAAANGHIRLFHNMTRSILEQVTETIRDEVKAVKIAVPYYDNELGALCRIRELFPTAELSLYIQNEKSTFPVEKFRKDPFGIVCPFDGFGESPQGSRTNFYHGKVFLFQTAAEDYVLYGSANCTQAALTSSFADGGNVECDLLEIGASGEFASFFEQMHVQQGEKLVCSIMTFEGTVSGNYYYKYGEEKDGYELHLGYISRKQDVKIYLDEMEVAFSESVPDKELVIRIPAEDLFFTADLFDLKIVYGNQSEDVRCWTFNRSILAEARTKVQGQDSLRDFQLDTEDDTKYREDRYRLLSAEATCYEELLEHQKRLAYFDQIKLEQEETEGEEDFIVDVVIPDEYRIAYRQNQMLSHIRGLYIARELKPSKGGWFPELMDENPEEKGPKTGVKVETARFTRPATTEEKRFEHFIKRKVRGMLGEKYVEHVSVEHYFGLAAVVLGIIHKYHDTERVQGIFDTAYVVRTRAELMSCILTKKMDGDLEKDLRTAIELKSYELLLRDYLLRQEETESSVRSEYDKWNKRLLLAMDQGLSIREKYPVHVEALKAQGLHPLDTAMLNLYLEKLFGYKNYPLLVKYICSVYPGAAIEMRDKLMVITATVDDILSHRRPETTVFQEIAKYGRNDRAVSRVQLTLRGRLAPKGKGTIDKIVHKVDMNYHRWTAVIYWKNGNVREEKAEYLGF